MTRRQIVLTASAAAAVVVVVAVVLLTRGGREAPLDEGAPATTVAPTSTSAPLPPAPLTGLPTDPAQLSRRALVVKIDNNEGLARPQAGVNEADVVIEEKVEGNISRFFAVFHSTDAPSVGPVRSARSTDVSLVGSYAVPLFAYSGANTTFLQAVRAAPLIDVGYDRQPSAYIRRDDRRAPDNLFTSTAALWALAPAAPSPPPTFATFRAGGPAPTGALPATSLAFTFGAGGAPVEYRWDAESGRWGRWQNGTADIDEAGTQVAPTNVIVQYVRYVDSGARDVNGNVVPEAQTVGEGDALVLLDGVAVRGTWQRASDAAMTSYRDTTGSTIALRPGRTWVALLPVGTPVDLG